MKRVHVFILVTAMCICALGVLFFSKPSHVSLRKGDVNKDGKIDETDARLMRTQFGCNHAFPCWNVIVGKTVTGDPIHTSDLDINRDDNVNELDTSAMGTE